MKMDARPQLTIVSWEAGRHPTPCSSTQTLHRRNGTGCRLHTGDGTKKEHEIRIKGCNMEAESRADRRGGGGAIFIEENISYEKTLNIPHKNRRRLIQNPHNWTRNQHHNTVIPSTSWTHWFRNYQTNTCLWKSHYMRRHECQDLSQEHFLGSC